MLVWLQVTATVAFGIATLVCFAWYAKSKNKGHLFMGMVFLLVGLLVCVTAFIATSTGRNNAFFAACTAGDVEAVQEALAKGADPNARDGNGITPLMVAAKGYRPNESNPDVTDHPDVVQLLLEQGADVNATTDSGFHALFWAARYGHEKVVKALIDKGADANTKDKDGMTALKWAITNRSVSPPHYDRVIAMLKEAGAKE